MYRLEMERADFLRITALKNCLFGRPSNYLNIFDPQHGPPILNIFVSYTYDSNFCNIFTIYNNLRVYCYLNKTK